MANNNDKQQLSLTLSEYVIQEAHEKCYETEIKSLKEFEKEKKAILQKERELIKRDIEKRMREKTMDKKIKHSSLVNYLRLQKMNTRNELMIKIQQDVQKKLFDKINSEKGFYQDLLKKLLVQGMIQLMERKVIVKCLEKDLQILKTQIQPAVNLFKELMNKQCNISDFEVDLIIDENNFLEERRLGITEKYKLDKSEEIYKCFGGILMMDETQLIICKNTLDVRVDQCIQGSLPDIRAELFEKK